MGKKCDLSDFECGVVVGVRRADLSTADQLGFFTYNHFRVYRAWSEISSKWLFCGQKCLVDARGQRRMA